MITLFDFCDEVGPGRILHLANPAAGLKAIVVVDNIAAGPALGGVRMATDVSLEECARLARAMTFKNIAAGLPHGGGKAVIFADPAMPVGEKEQVIRAFAQAIKDDRAYIPGPDMGTDERCMAWVKDETGRVAGLPREVGGIPLDEIGATGFGVAIAAESAQAFCDVRLEGAKVAIQGFGAVGKHAALQLVKRGAIVVAAADSQAMVENQNGIDLDALLKVKAEEGTVSALSGADVMDRDAIVGVDCDIWIPAARPDVLTADNAGRLKAKLVLQGANIPATPEAEDILHRNGVLSVPDFIANAGGVISASVEYRGGVESDAFSEIESKIRRNTTEVLARARDKQVQPRRAAAALARARLDEAMGYGRWRAPSPAR